MLPVTLHTATGERLTLTIKTGWHDVTAAEYIAMQGKPEPEILQLLTGLTAEQLAGLNEPSALWLAEMLAGFEPLTDAEPADVKGETVGQFEAAKSFLQRYFRESPGQCRAMVLPIIYGLYKAEKVNGEWKQQPSLDLAEAAKAMPADEVIPFALATLARIEQVNREYDEMMNAMAEAKADYEPAPEPEQQEKIEAREARLAPFGFYPALCLLSGNNLLDHEAIMKKSVREVYHHLYYLSAI